MSIAIGSSRAAGGGGGGVPKLRSQVISLFIVDPRLDDVGSRFSQAGSCQCSISPEVAALEGVTMSRTRYQVAASQRADDEEEDEDRHGPAAGIRKGGKELHVTADGGMLAGSSQIVCHRRWDNCKHHAERATASRCQRWCWPAWRFSR
jgi:hypothetical protein